MEENDLDSITRHWLSVHKSLRTSIRRLVTFLALLALFAMVQGFRHQTNLYEDYQQAREFTLQLQAQGPRFEALERYVQICEKDMLACKDGSVRARLESIREVRWELDRFLSRQRNVDLYRFQGFEFGFVAYSLILIFAPLGVLGVVFLNLKKTAKISFLLRDKAHRGDEIQQNINSIFSERATENVGDGRWLYATAWILTLTLLGLLPAFIYMYQTGLELNTTVSITEIGEILPLPNTTLGNRILNNPSDEILAIVLSESICVFILSGLICRTLLNQLRPTDANH